MLDPIGAIILTEGGFSDDPDDRGGPTKYGITQQTLSNYLGRPASMEEVRTLTPALARSIYEKNYLHGPHIDQIPEPLMTQVLDIAINMGQGTAVRMLQRVLGITDDGVIGHGTLGCIRCGDIRKINDGLVDARIQRYHEIAGHDPSQMAFLRGWTSRAEAFRL